MDPGRVDPFARVNSGAFDDHHERDPIRYLKRIAFSKPVLMVDDRHYA
jgi:hypothetical protein